MLGPQTSRLKQASKVDLELEQKPEAGMGVLSYWPGKHTSVGQGGHGLNGYVHTKHYAFHTPPISRECYLYILSDLFISGIGASTISSLYEWHKNWPNTSSQNQREKPRFLFYPLPPDQISKLFGFTENTYCVPLLIFILTPDALVQALVVYHKYCGSFWLVSWPQVLIPSNSPISLSCLSCLTHINHCTLLWTKVVHCFSSCADSISSLF